MYTRGTYGTILLCNYMSLSDIVIVQPCVSPATACSGPFCAYRGPTVAPSTSDTECVQDDWTSGALWHGGQTVAEHLLQNPQRVSQD